MTACPPPLTTSDLESDPENVMVLNSSVDCCTRDVTVQVPEGRVVSNIFQEFAFFAPSFYVNDSSGSMVFKSII
uniref:Uncharacterized protein n=1 Tax=Romanomermis culicivorax TaxID=13658 RepID=A0A915KN89_ROMCU